MSKSFIYHRIGFKDYITPIFSYKYEQENQHLMRLFANKEWGYFALRSGSVVINIFGRLLTRKLYFSYNLAIIQYYVRFLTEEIFIEKYQFELKC